jgi:hypothetical protein
MTSKRYHSETQETDYGWVSGKPERQTNVRPAVGIAASEGWSVEFCENCPAASGEEYDCSGCGISVSWAEMQRRELGIKARDKRPETAIQAALMRQANRGEIPKRVDSSPENLVRRKLGSE